MKTFVSNLKLSSIHWVLLLALTFTIPLDSQAEDIEAVPSCSSSQYNIASTVGVLPTPTSGALPASALGSSGSVPPGAVPPGENGEPCSDLTTNWQCLATDSSCTVYYVIDTSYTFAKNAVLSLCQNHAAFPGSCKGIGCIKLP